MIKGKCCSCAVHTCEWFLSALSLSLPYSSTPPSSLLEAAVVEKGLLEGRWNVAGPVSRSEDTDGLFVTEGLVLPDCFSS